MAADELDKDLAKAIQVAKKKPRNFAIVGKGSNVLKLLLDKKPLKDGALMKAKKEVQGNVIVKGVVQGSGGELVFQLTEQPSITDIKLKAFIVDATRVNVKARFEVVPAIQEIDDDAPDDALPVEAPARGAEASAAAAPEAPPPPTPGPSADQLIAALNKMSPAIKQAVADHPDRKAEILKPVAAFQSHVKAHELPQAKDALLQVGALLKSLKGGPGAGGPKPSVGSPDTPPQKPSPSRPEPLESQAAVRQPAAGEAAVELPAARLQEAAALWAKVRQQAYTDIADVKKSVQAEVQDEEDAEELRAAAQAGRMLDAVLGRLDTQLEDQLGAAAAAPDGQRGSLTEAVRQQVGEYRKFVEADAVLRRIDGNDFNGVKVQGPLLAALDEIEKRLTP